MKNKLVRYSDDDDTVIIIEEKIKGVKEIIDTVEGMYLDYFFNDEIENHQKPEEIENHQKPEEIENHQKPEEIENHQKPEEMFRRNLLQKEIKLNQLNEVLYLLNNRLKKLKKLKERKRMFSNNKLNITEFKESKEFVKKLSKGLVNMKEDFKTISESKLYELIGSCLVGKKKSPKGDKSDYQIPQKHGENK
jgi:flagellar biosynthesis GTPase FlhF